jgi:endonuclease/exonuclease/phosphatase (EEP) superfamily protein YafD
VAQAVELLQGRVDRPFLLVGDLNLPPRDHALDALYATHDEADRLPRWCPRPTHQGLRKLDYVFVPRGTVEVASRLRISFRPRWSDHARLAVDVRVTGGTWRREGRTPPDGSPRKGHTA